MPGEQLSNEASVSAEITESGVKASAKSRTVSSLDRLIGSVVDTGTAFLEGKFGNASTWTGSIDVAKIDLVDVVGWQYRSRDRSKAVSD
jgi:hypothetical protein